MSDKLICLSGGDSDEVNVLEVKDHQKEVPKLDFAKQLGLFNKDSTFQGSNSSGKLSLSSKRGNTSSTNLTPKPKSIPDGMVISVKNSQNASGASTEVKIVLSNTPTAMRPKSNARKSMSSFEPQIPKRIKLDPSLDEVVTLSDDDDQTPPVTVAATSSQISKPREGNRIKLETLPYTKKEIKKESDPEADVSSAIETFLTKNGRQFTSAEFDTLRHKFKKRESKLIKDSKHLEKLAAFIKVKTKQVEEAPLDAFKIVQEIFNEMDGMKMGRQCHTVPPKKEEDKTANANIEPGNNPKLGKNEEDTSSNLPSSNKSSKEAEEKRKRTIVKLEHALKKTKKAIDKLEREELNLDDLEDEASTYIRMSRYRKHFIKLYKRIAELKNQDSGLERQQDKKFRLGEASRFPELNKKIERKINKRKLDKKFPDFPEILDIFTKYNNERNLGFTKEIIKMEAEKTFKRIGEILKSRRVKDELDNLYGYLPEDDVPDPANENPELEEKLQESGKIASEKTAQIVQEFVQRQIERKTTGADDNSDNENDNSDNGETKDGNEDNSDDDDSETDKCNDDPTDDESSGEANPSESSSEDQSQD